jgi:hypothetical protein
VATTAPPRDTFMILPPGKASAFQELQNDAVELVRPLVGGDVSALLSKVIPIGQGMLRRVT